MKLPLLTVLEKKPDSVAARNANVAMVIGTKAINSKKASLSFERNTLFISTLRAPEAEHKI